MNTGKMPPRFPLPGAEPNPLETLAFAILGIAVAVGAALWLTGELSGRVVRRCLAERGCQRDGRRAGPVRATRG